MTKSDILSDGEILMTNSAIIRDAYGVPAMFVGSKTGKEDAPFVFIRVGDEERRMRWAEWDALPAWTEYRPLTDEEQREIQTTRAFLRELAAEEFGG